MNKKIFQICLKTVEETKTKKKSIKDCILELQPSKKKKKMVELYKDIKLSLTIFD